jgi:hypothetical protein
MMMMMMMIMMIIIIIIIIITTTQFNTCLLIGWLNSIYIIQKTKHRLIV